MGMLWIGQRKDYEQKKWFIYYGFRKEGLRYSFVLKRPSNASNGKIYFEKANSQVPRVGKNGQFNFLEYSTTQFPTSSFDLHTQFSQIDFNIWYCQINYIKKLLFALLQYFPCKWWIGVSSTFMRVMYWF